MTRAALHRPPPGWSTGAVTAGGSLQEHTFCVCLLAMDQLSIDDRLCR